MKEWTEFKSDNPESFKKDAKDYADKVGIKLNPNEKAVEMAIKGLFKNKKEKGELYCPCRFVSGNKEKDKEIICPCVYHRGEIEIEGHCRCLLFSK